jgi:hypothetical protein
MNLVEQVRHLASRVPSPPNEPLPKGVSDDVISAFELRIGLAVPASLRELLQFVNGPCIGPRGLLGIATLRSSLDIEDVLQRYPHWRENCWIPVAGDGCGNYYVLNANESNAPVYLVDTALDADHLAYAVGSSLWRFLWFLLNRELGSKGWPFSKDYVLSHDPEIAKCAFAPAPWDVP